MSRQPFTYHSVAVGERNTLPLREDFLVKYLSRNLALLKPKIRVKVTKAPKFGYKSQHYFKDDQCDRVTVLGMGTLMAFQVLARLVEISAEIVKVENTLGSCSQSQPSQLGVSRIFDFEPNASCSPSIP